MRASQRFFATLFCLLLGVRLQAGSLAAVTVTTSSLGAQIPADFLGFSMEWQYAQDFFGTTGSPNTHFFQLMKNLGTGVVRIGGNSTDEWCWDAGPSECQNTTTASMINSIFNASATTGYGVIAGVNLTSGSTANAVDTVKAFINDGLNAYPGSRLIGAEIGNEPDLFDTSTNTQDQTYPSTYTIADNESDYKKFLTALDADATAKTAPWTGPAFAGGWSSQIGSWVGAAQANGVGASLANPAIITLHNYPLSNCGSSAGTGTITDLLSASAMNSHASTFGGYEGQVAAKGYQLRVAETNSSACGGTPGVSDVDAAALWGLDDLFRYAQVGIVGVNFHGGGTEDYSPVFASGNGATVAPLYYGMLMFANATGKYLLPCQVSSADNVTAYSVAAGATADPQVFVINKDLAASGVVSIKPSESLSSATLLLLSAPSLSSAASGIQYGGVQPDANTGSLPSPATTPLVAGSDGTFQFTLPNACAALLTLHRGTPTPTPTPVVASTWRVNAGGPAYTDTQGAVWAADENYSGGTAAVGTMAISGAKPGAADQALYQSQRYGASFSYSFNVPAGSYQLTLKFAETYFTAAGSRVFNVSVNGTQVLTNFDIFAAAGGQDAALDEVFDDIAPQGGLITIDFGPASANNAEVQAIQIIPEPPTPTPTRSATRTVTGTPSPSVSATPSRSATNSATVTTTATPSATASASSTRSATASGTITMTPSLTATGSPSASASPQGTVTASATSSVTSSPVTSPTKTETPMLSPTASTTPSASPSASPNDSSTPTASPTPWSSASPTPSATGSVTAKGSFTASATATPTVTSTVTLSATPSATSHPATFTATVTLTVTATASATPTVLGTKSVTPVFTQNFTATLTPTLGYPTASVTAFGTSSAQGSGGPLVILGAQAVPNPDPTAWWVDLEGPADSVSVELFSTAMVRVLTVQAAGGSAGWIKVPLPFGWRQGLARGLYFYRVVVRRGSIQARPWLGRLVLL